MNNNSQGYQQPAYNQQPMYNQPPKKKGLSGCAIAAIVVGFIFLVLAIIVVMIIVAIVDDSEKMVCKSEQGNITIMYNDDTITGYTATKMTYDLDGQKEYAERIGVEAYLDEFETWFETNTTGTCTR